MKYCSTCEHWLCRCGDCVYNVDKEDDWWCQLFHKFCRNIVVCYHCDPQAACDGEQSDVMDYLTEKIPVITEKEREHK